MIFNMIGKGSGGGGVETEGMYCWAKLTGKPELPIGYTKLESLTTTGVEYFDSGYLINPTTTSKNLKIVADTATALPTTSIYHVNGHGGAQPLVYIGITNNKRYGYAHGTADVATSVTADGKRHLWMLDYKNGKFTVDNVVNITFTPQNITASANFYIGAYNMNGTATNKHIEQIYSWEFYENDILIKRLVPCLDNANVCCLYDEVSGNTIYANGGTPTAGTSLGKTIAEGYVLSDNLNQYPQDGYHTDGYYYKLLENNIAWDERGRYAWAKKDPDNLTTESIGYADAASYLSISSKDNVYTISTTSAGGWGYNYINTDLIDTTEKPIRVTYKATLSGQNMFLGFADTQGKTYSIMNESLYLTSAGAVNHQRKGAQVAGYGSWTINDVFVMEIYQGYFTVTKNGTQLFKSATTLTSACFVADLYATNKTYGEFTFESEMPSILGYVVGNEEYAYPDDGLADDGYYYVKVGATKITIPEPEIIDMKYANGSGSATVTGGWSPSCSFTVSGMGFAPKALYLSWYANGSSNQNESEVINFNGTTKVVHDFNGSTITLTDDGFTFSTTSGLSSSSAVSYTWYALGM